MNALNDNKGIRGGTSEINPYKDTYDKMIAERSAFKEMLN